ncbi:MAG: hypothetical protein E7603_00195 [Ruminococcaceae bacterium]|nr:hypothetical protein [Oscillospiraceae bacterium]
MKRILSIVLALAVLATMCLAFASCGKLSGTYEASGLLGKTELTFKGDTVTITKGTIEAEGTYEIKDDKITIEIENDGNLGWDDILKVFNGEHDFEKGKDYIKIGSTKYTKAD